MEATLSQDYLRSVRERKDGRVGGQERQWCEIVWALRQPEEMEVGFHGDGQSGMRHL